MGAVNRKLRPSLFGFLSHSPLGIFETLAMDNVADFVLYLFREVKQNFCLG